MLNPESLESKYELNLNCVKIKPNDYNIKLLWKQPPHAYKFSIFFWSIMGAYSSKKVLVGLSIVSPAYRNKATTHKRFTCKYELQLYNICIETFTRS